MTMPASLRRVLDARKAATPLVRTTAPAPVEKPGDITDIWADGRIYKNGKLIGHMPKTP